MKSKLLLAVSAFVASFQAYATPDVHEYDKWMVKVGHTVYNVEVLSVTNEVVRIKYEDGLIGQAKKDDLKWLTKLSSDYI